MKSVITNCFSYANFDGMVGKKCKDLWGQVEDLKDDMRHYISIPLFGPLLLQFSRACLIMLFNLIEIWKVDQKG